MAHKYCELNGTWFRHPESNQIWSNYTTCVNLQDLSVSRARDADDPRDPRVKIKRLDRGRIVSSFVKGNEESRIRGISIARDRSTL
jgi:hypothetical protein